MRKRRWTSRDSGRLPYQEDGTIERVLGPELGDYTGLPLTGSRPSPRRQLGRRSHPQSSRVSVPGPTRSTTDFRGLAPIRVSAEYDDATQRIVAFHVHIGAYENKRTIYLDGRPHPPDYAAHTFQGFSTGRGKATR